MNISALFPWLSRNFDQGNPAIRILKQLPLGRGWLILLLAVGLTMAGSAEQAPTAFCRFVPERMDDFAWENDRVAFRMYGPELWKNPAKQCGSGIDVWVKKVRYPIIDKWMKDKLKDSRYHIDTGEGADFYKVDKTLGCGGLGFWVNDNLLINRHFVTQKVIQGNGERIEFELTYAPLEVDGKTITETKRISMEMGSNLFKVENSFAISGGGSVMVAVGIVRRAGKDEVRNGPNWIGYAEPPGPENGQTYCGVVLSSPGTFKQTPDHVLMLAPVKDGQTLTYHAGAAWSKGLDFKNASQWMEYLREQSAKSNSPPDASTGKKAPDSGVSSKKEAAMTFFRDWPEGKSPAAVGKKVAENFLPRGHYQDHKDFRYPDAIVWFGALKVAHETGDKELAGQLTRRYDTYRKNPKLVPEKFHVDYAVLGIVPLELYRLTNDPALRKLGMHRADGQWHKPTADGVTSQARYWVDDIFMIAAIQTAAYRVTNDPRYLDRAALTSETYLKRLQKEDGLFWHAEDSPFVWGRGVGWYAAGMTEILKFLPPSHANYPGIIGGYEKMMAALLKNQAPSGLWRQLVDKPESWEETSGSAMFAYAMVTGVRRGWLDEETYGPVARKAWLALVDQIDDAGNLQQVCVGTNKGAKEVGSDLEKQYQFYMNRPRIAGDYHGQAPLLWTAAALLEKAAL
jgi:unsaturated rhamnogalacturonyl hydrolase